MALLLPTLHPLMQQAVNQPVSMILSIDAQTGQVRPERVKWDNRIYRLTKFGFVHTERRGLKKFHIFTFSTSTLDMCVELDADNLHCTLLAIDDGM